MPFPLTLIFLGSQLVTAAAEGVPTIDVQKTCRAAASVTSSVSTQRDVDICVSSELKAREQMVKDWGQYATGDKARCVQTAPRAYLPSYVEWLTCLEMETAVKKMRDEQKTPASPTQRQR